MRRSLFVLAFSGFLTASWAAQPALLAQLWDLFRSWGPSTIDAGCIMDPDGRCRPAQQIDEGCGMDPDGRCRPAQQINEGCGMDPNGCPKGS